uniref:Uncharacterized protein n=1 Tax=Anguilla anguilla TaxID=7936 RepID=A0A0E9U5T7_ANGAN
MSLQKTDQPLRVLTAHQHVETVLCISDTGAVTTLNV